MYFSLVRLDRRAFKTCPDTPEAAKHNMSYPGDLTGEASSDLPGDIFENSKRSCWRLAVSCWPRTVCDLKRGSWCVRLPSFPARPEALSGLTANRQRLTARRSSLVAACRVGPSPTIPSSATTPARVLASVGARKALSPLSATNRGAPRPGSTVRRER